MTTLILGANGQLGRALQRQFPDAVALDRSKLDVSDPEAVRNYRWDGVDVVLNAAGWTAVDAAEDPANHAAVRAANADAVGYLARAVRTCGAILVHVSSEYVFDGRHEGPHPEDWPANPLSVYGQSKADGDTHAGHVTKHYLIRTTWVAGEGGNFVRTMAGLADRGVSPTVVDDQIGRPTFAADLAAGIAHLLDTGARFGTYNLTNAGEPASWADVAAAVFEARGRSADDITRISTEKYFADKSGAATRPLNSVLDLSKIAATGFNPRDWRPALADYVTSLGVSG